MTTLSRIGAYGGDQGEEAECGGAGAAVCACGGVWRPGGGLVRVGGGGVGGGGRGGIDGGGGDRGCARVSRVAWGAGGGPLGAGRARGDHAGRGDRPGLPRGDPGGDDQPGHGAGGDPRGGSDCT